MTYPFYIILGILPSIIWLLFYLRKDAHPESNRQILKIFFCGMLATVPAIFLEIGFFKISSRFVFLNESLIYVLNIFVGVALIEEFLKYFVVKWKVLKSSELDEPIDVMLYMIIAALGFAALENTLILFELGPSFYFPAALSISVFRFWGATFLHALCSGLLGFFMAMSFYKTRKRIVFFFSGLGIATVLHGFFNFSIIKIGESFSTAEGQLLVVDYSQFIFFLAFLIAILIGLAIFLTLGFKKLKKIKSICKT
jgi:RsiW-degrading membrane proteinase PrsW (M82 family)